MEEAAASSATLSDQADGLTNLVAFFKLSRAMEGHTNEMTNFTDLFTRAKSAHIAWKEKVKAIVEGRLSPDDKNLTCKECELGNWISREGMQRYGRLEEMSRLEQVHQQMHRTIEEILAYKRKGDQVQCEASYRNIEPLSKQVVQYLNALEKKMTQVGSGGSAPTKQRAAAKPAVPSAPASKPQPVVQQAAASDDSEWSEF